jgi:hypothetical protein
MIVGGGCFSSQRQGRRAKEGVGCVVSERAAMMERQRGQKVNDKGETDDSNSRGEMGQSLHDPSEARITSILVVLSVCSGGLPFAGLDYALVCR